MKDNTALALNSLAEEAMTRMPGKWGHRMFGLIADAYWWRRGKDLRQLEDNLLPIIGNSNQARSLRSISRANMRSYMRYREECAHLSTMEIPRAPAPKVVIGSALLQNCIQNGRGVVLALPHMGNWEYAGAYLATTMGPITTVALRFGPDHFYESYLQTRRELGIEILPLASHATKGSVQGGPAHIFASLAQRLRAGGVVSLLADRSINGKGVDVDFFGRKARFPAGPATLAVHTGAALLPAALWYEEDGWSGRIYEQVHPPTGGTRHERITQMTRALGGPFECAIAEHVEDWHMTRPFFSATTRP